MVHLQLNCSRIDFLLRTTAQLNACSMSSAKSGPAPLSSAAEVHEPPPARAAIYSVSVAFHSPHVTITHQTHTSHPLQHPCARPPASSLPPPISPLHDLLCACVCALQLDAVTAAAAQQLLRSCDAASPPPRSDIAVLAASLLVAVKAQNGDRKLRDIINVVHAALRPSSPPLTIGQEFWSLRDAVVLMEQRLLRACAFQVEFDASQLQASPAVAARCALHPFLTRASPPPPPQLVSISAALSLPPKCCRLALAILTDCNRCVPRPSPLSFPLSHPHSPMLMLATHAHTSARSCACQSAYATCSGVGVRPHDVRPAAADCA